MFDTIDGGKVEARHEGPNVELASVKGPRTPQAEQLHIILSNSSIPFMDLAEGLGYKFEEIDYFEYNG